ncbi:uncharacterized protein DDB_G0283697 isoform X2 [Atheta coriaria]|uniref:uncharacterized protein DDB_G0283697 isoform X2 n=1 Tax=Dalotia coriaria TaxID=877792 RepID=UPI0031F3898A
MGCSAAKNLTVEQLNGDTGNENGTETRKVSITRRASEVPPLQSDEPPEEVLDSGTLNNLQEHSFEEDAESIIQKHPPKRFQKLEEQEQTSPNLSLQRLQEKLDEAEKRRQQILQQRVTSAKVRKGIKKQNNIDGEGDEDGDDEEEDEGEENPTESPPDIPPEEHA